MKLLVIWNRWTVGGFVPLQLNNHHKSELLFPQSRTINLSLHELSLLARGCPNEVCTTRYPQAAGQDQSLNGVVVVVGLLPSSIDKDSLYCFSFLSPLNFIFLLSALIYVYDLLHISCLNNPIIVFFFFSILISVSFGKGDVFYNRTIWGMSYHI